MKLIASILLTSAAAALGQTAPSTLPPPIAPEQIQYRFWPEQFVQWLGTEVPYTMIELYVDSSAPGGTLYDAVLTERASGKRIHYSNQQSMVDLDKRLGGEAYLTRIQLDRPAAPATGATYLLRFTDHAGQPVLWQFVQGSDIAERGGGLSPTGNAPILMYRERAAVAGEGTALKIGNTVSPADVWTEISQPPYFIAYHGALSEDVNIGVFAGAAPRWEVLSGPTTLAAGAEWKLRAEDGVGCILHVQEVNGTEATILENDEHLPGRQITLFANWNSGAWSIERMQYAPAEGGKDSGMTIEFVPPIASASGTVSKFQVLVGHKTKIANGTVQDDKAKQAISWNFRDPVWLRGKAALISTVRPAAEQTPAQTAAK